jgi:hypothetical protein
MDNVDLGRGKMKKIFFISAFSALVLLASVSASYSGYSLTQLTSNPYNDFNPQINDNGYVVWQGFDGPAGDTEIFLYDGTTISKLTDNAILDVDPQINNTGYVVWEGGGGVYLYNGTSTIPLSSGLHPQINDNGYVVWQRFDGNDYEILLYDGATILQLTNNDYEDRYPKISNNGYVVWEGFDGNDYEIFLYDGATVTNISNNTRDNFNPQINDNGHVVWEGGGIFLYKGTKAVKISGSGEVPQINNSDSVVWRAWEWGTIFLYTGASAIQLSLNGNFPRINDRGYIVWRNGDGSISLYDGKAELKFKKQGVTFEYNPKINNSGHVVWEGWDGNDYDVYLAMPPVTVLSPNGGEVLSAGSPHEIRWVSAPNKADTFNLKYSLDNGLTWLNIDSGIKGSVYSWNVLPPANNKKLCLVSVTGYDSSSAKVGSDKSNSTFAIEVVKLTSPNGGESLTAGAIHAITWTTNDTIGPVAGIQLYSTTNGGTTWKEIDPTVTKTNTGSYDWIVPTVTSAKTKCKVKLVLKDASGKTLGSDISDKVFTIQPTP